MFSFETIFEAKISDSPLWYPQHLFLFSFKELISSTDSKVGLALLLWPLVLKNHLLLFNHLKIGWGIIMIIKTLSKMEKIDSKSLI